MITDTGRLLRDGGPVHPQALLERATARGGPLARALEDFFTSNGLALLADHDERKAGVRRQHRLDGIPASFRPAAIAFSEHELAGRLRAQHAGTGHPVTARSKGTLPRCVTTSRGITGWPAVSTGDIETFLATQPSTAARRLGGLRRFFRFAARRRMILINPAKTITVTRPHGFTGPSLTRDRQRELFRRWTHRHRRLPPARGADRAACPDPRSHHPGNPAPDHRRHHPGHLRRLAARTTAGHPSRPMDLGRHRSLPGAPAGTQLREPAPAHHLADQGHPGPSRRRIRQEHAAGGRHQAPHPAILTDPRARQHRRLKLVASAYGMTYQAVIHYLADNVDPTRLPNPCT